MIIGIMELDLRIFESHTLKDKRRVLKSFVDRTRKYFNVSIAEIGHNEVVNYTTIGLSCISNEKRFIESVFDKILGRIETDYNVELVLARKEFI